MRLPTENLMLFLVFLILSAACSRKDGADEQAIPAPATVTHQKAVLGQAVPDFTLKDHNGNAVRLSDYRGRIVVLEWVNPECPFVQRHYREGTFTAIVRDYGDRDLTWLAINSTHWTTNPSNQQWHAKYQLPYPILDDSSGTVGRMYSAKTTPHMFIIDKEGRLAYAGGIDNDDQGTLGAERIQYVRLALDDLIDARTPRISQARSYGCSVKYK